MTTNPVSPDTKIDLSNCDREPIHLLNNVQRFGCLVAVTTDWIVCHVSENVSEFLDVSPDDMIGRPLLDFFAEDAVHQIRGRLAQLDGPDAVERLFGMQILPGKETLFNAGIHASGRKYVIELERHTPEQRSDYTSYVRPMIARVSKATTVEKLCSIAARQIKALIGFDRVMVYRFAEDESGEVIAEAVSPNVDSFLGLHYPATDIPQQARQLYRRNMLRIISDVGEEPSPLIPQRGPDGELLDLSMSGLRAVSPIHIEYLKNMGVEASLSISILRRGKLWGLFACHHYEPRVLPYEIRSAAELFAEMFSFVLDQLLNDEAVVHANQARDLHDRLMVRLAGGQNLREHFSTISDALLSVIPADGVAAWIEGEYITTGITPNKEEFGKIARFLNTAAASQVYATDKLGDAMAGGEDLNPRVAGLLALPVSRTPRDYIVLFRQEFTKHVNWAGNPEKPVTPGPNGMRLTPRKSFEAWQETVHGQSEPWTTAQKAAAEQLRITLLEVVLRMSDAANVERSRANERQELLIAELNHRVRNILNLVSGLIGQTSHDVGSITEFSNVLRGRVQALARAHDQITQQQWGPSSLRELITTELNAYFGPKSDRVIIDGPDALLQPNAFGTLALVIHDLATNSAKYGALSDSSGSISLKIAETHDGALSIAWRERGGPAVQAPTRQGFGSAIIQKSIPFELRGTADIRFELTGLEVDLTIPGSHVQSFKEPEAPAAEKELITRPGNSETDIGDVLVVEDNMIIALHAEDLLVDAGAASVTVCASVEDALSAIERTQFSIALLDVNLGRETSAPIAMKLSEIGVPFLFATGYGDASVLSAQFPGTPIIKKPYQDHELLKQVRQNAARPRA